MLLTADELALKEELVGNDKYLVFQNSSIDIFEKDLELICFKDINHLLPCAYITRDTNHLIYYNVSKKVSIEKFVKIKRLDKSEFLFLIYEMLRVFESISSNSLSPEKLLINPKWIYINPKNYSISLLYIPVNFDVSDKFNFSNIFYSLSINITLRKVTNEYDFYFKLQRTIKENSNNFVKLTEFLNELLTNEGIRNQAVLEKIISENSKVEASSFEVNSVSVTKYTTKITSDSSENNDTISNYKIETILKNYIKRDTIFKFFSVQPKYWYFIFVNTIILSVFGSSLLLINYNAPNVTFTRNISIFAGLLLIFVNFATNMLYNYVSKFHSENNANKTIELVQPNPSIEDDCTVVIEKELFTPEIKGLLKVAKLLDTYVDIDADEFFIGRDPDLCNLTIENKTIGRNHSKIIFVDNDYYIVDLNSKNGTFLNGQKIEPNMEILLNNNDELKFSDEVFIFITNQNS